MAIITPEELTKPKAVEPSTPVAAEGLPPASTPPQEPVNTSVTTETTDLEPINKVLQAMQAEGLTYGQAFDKYYPKPTRNTANEQTIRKQQKLAIFSDMLRLVTEGVGAAGGATIAQRDQRNPYAGLQARLMQEYSTYAKNMQDWQSKGVDAAMKDLQMRSDMYRNAPKTRTTVQNNDWDKAKFTEGQNLEKDKMKQAREIADKDREAANQRAAASAAASAENKDPKVTQLTFADGNGTAVIPNNAYKGLMSAAFQAMMSDPNFKSNSKEIEVINNDYSFEGKTSKIQAYVEQHAHESPAAQNLIRNNAQQYTRSTGVLAPSFEKNKEPSLSPGGDRLILPRKKTTGSLLPK